MSESACEFGDDFCQYCTARGDNNLWWGGGILVHMCVCVWEGGEGGLGLFDYVRLHVCAPALHFAKHPTGTSKRDIQPTLFLETHNTLKLGAFWLFGHYPTFIHAQTLPLK